MIRTSLPTARRSLLTAALKTLLIFLTSKAGLILETAGSIYSQVLYPWVPHFPLSLILTHPLASKYVLRNATFQIPFLTEATS